MNYELLDPFAQDYPESLTRTIHAGHSTAIRFSRRGDLLASGLVDGGIVIWDLVTWSVSCVLRGHTRTIQSVVWSADGRFLLSAARDWKIILWDLAKKCERYVIRTGSPVWMADLHPDDINTVCAALVDESPIVARYRDDQVQITHLATEPMRGDGAGEGPAKQLTLVCVFDPSGRYVYGGTSRGWLNVIDYDSLEIVHSYRIATATLKEIRFTLSKKHMVTNSSDRIVRTMPTYPHRRAVSTEPSSPSSDGERDDGPDQHDDLQIEHKFQDQVNRLQWNSCAFSANSDYVMASTYQSTHDIYVWERNMGSLVKILEGPREELTDIDWHPVQPMVAAIGIDSGCIYVWSVERVESWSAFAPDFREVEENAIYEEREDEFDIQPEGMQQPLNQASKGAQQDPVMVVDRAQSAQAPFVMPVSDLDTDVADDAASQQDVEGTVVESNGKVVAAQAPRKRKR